MVGSAGIRGVPKGVICNLVVITNGGGYRRLALRERALFRGAKDVNCTIGRFRGKSELRRFDALVGNAMSSVVIPCPGCQSPLAITPEMVGQTIACPACGQTIQLAAAPAPQSPAPTAPASAAPAPPARQALPRAQALPVAAPLTPGAAQRALPPMPAGSQPAAAPQPAPAQQIFVAPQPAAKPDLEAIRRQSKQSAIAVILVTWVVVATLLIAAGVLIYGLRLRALAEEEGAAVAQAPTQSLPTTKPAKPINPAPSVPSTPQIPPQEPTIQPMPAPSSAPPPRVQVEPDQPKPAQPRPIQPRPAPPPQPIAPAPPPPPADPLADLADVWRLPALISTQPEKAATLAREPAEPIGVSIRGLAADVPGSGAIFTEATSASAAWDILFVSDLASGAGRVKLAELRRDGRDFSFAWAQPLADPALRRQMSNCLLEVRHGNSAKTVQLREPVRPGPWTVSMSDGVQTAEFTLPDPPKADTLRLEIRELVSFPRDVALREEHKSITAGQKAVIQFTEMPGAEMGVQLIRLASGTLVVRVQSEFRENAATKFEMSLSRLASLEEGVSKSLDRAKRELPGEQALLSRIQSDLKSAQATRPSTLAQQAARDQLISSLASKLKRSVNKVGSLQKQIVESEGRLAAVPKIRTFLESLDQKAQIRFAVCAECGDRDLLLVDGTQPAGAE
jgi:hypothetical protein